MLQITDVVKHLLIINIIMFLAMETIFIQYKPLLMMFFPGTTYFQPFQIVSHMFLHATPSHLFFNMFGLFMFGPAVEAAWGPRRFLFYYFFAGFGALASQLLVMYLTGSMSPLLGASGAIFGLLAAFGMLFPERQIMLIFPPIPMKAKVMVVLYGAIELFLGFGGFNTGVAHFAHLGGAVFGALLILYWRKFGTNL